MSASNLASLALSPAAQEAREEALRIARTQPPASIKPRPKHDGPRDNWRDTIESIVIAFILAFIFRTFVCEAFIIPTGSMAETLYGRHKDVICTQCKTRFRVGASSEVDRDNGYFLPNRRLKYGFCPNCRFQMDIEDELPFAGDRILVNKFPYEFTEPKRWEVVVFKFPGDPKISYIKRLIGLPEETISVLAGDLYRQSGELGKAEILRKPPKVQQETQILVYDNDKPAHVLLEQGFPERWAPVKAENPETADQEGWQADAKTRSFTIDATQKHADSRPSWIRYRHYVPKPVDWQRAGEKKQIELPPQLMLIADYYAYNSGFSGEFPINDPETDAVGDRWVGDLTLKCELEVLQSSGLVTLELVEGRRKYHCDFDLATGLATLSYQDESNRLNAGAHEENVPIGEAQTVVGKAGKYALEFANVDDRLLLGVNGRWIAFQRNGKPVDGSYDFPQLAVERVPTHQDLSPIGIAAQQSKVRISKLLITRDIHYTYKNENDAHNARILLEDPVQYADGVKNKVPERFQLAKEELLVLGDNSPCSSDSRMWNHKPSHPYALNRNLMIGKAFLIYWPHGVPFPGPRGFSPYLGEALNSKLYYWHEELK
ncbi:MAG: sipV 1, partial [Planctomycetaceae bacterium]|nr:sipV 1 [Planctomycetaceae bacterium]